MDDSFLPNIVQKTLNSSKWPQNPRRGAGDGTLNSTNEQAAGIVNVEELAEDSDHAHEVQEQTGMRLLNNFKDFKLF